MDELTKEQKIGAFIVGGLLLLIGGYKFYQYKKAKKWDSLVSGGGASTSGNEQQTETAPTTSTSNYTGYRAEGDLTEDEKGYELYKKMIGMANYIETSPDSNAKRLRTQIESIMKNNNIDKDDAMLKVLIQMNKGKGDCVKKAVEKMNGDLRGHVDYFAKNGKFKV